MSGWSFETDRVENWAYQEEVFTPDECKQIVTLGNTLDKIVAEVDALAPKKDVVVRKGKIAWLPINANSQWIYERLTSATMSLNTQFFNFDLFGFSENLQFTEYKAPDSHYNFHIDKAYLSIPRKLSIVVQLTDPKKYEGGELQISTQSNPTNVHKSQGTLIAFPSYVLHRVTPVTKGKRNSLVGWTTGRPFK
jgi:PKHD-type hydroxylase